MANPYEIPWAPPDISSGAAMLIGVLNQNEANRRAEENAATQRMFAENSLKRMSAQEARDKQTYEQGQLDRRQKAIQSANELRRQGRHGEADMMLKLHGIAATPVIGPSQTTPAEVVTPMSAAANIVPTGEGPVSFEPTVATPMMAAASTQPRGVTYDKRMRLGPDDVFGGAPTEPIDMEAADLAPPQPTELAPGADNETLPLTIPGETIPGKPTGAYSYKGPTGEDLGTFDPAQEEAFRAERAGRVSEALGPMGAKVEKVAALLAAGDIDQKEAGALLTMLRAEASQSAALGSKAALQEDKQAFDASQNELYKRTFEEALALAEANGGSRIAAARVANPYRQEGVNDRLFSLLDRRAKAVRDTGLYNKLATNDKVVRGIMANIATGTEGLQHKDAQIQLARYFRQAQPTEGEMHLLYNNLGGWTDSFNQFKAKVLRGDLSPEQLRQMKKSARTVLHEHEEDKKRFLDVARAGLGPKSGLDEIPDQAQKQFDMMAAELGIAPGELPPLYQTEGGVTLGTKKAPKTAPRGTAKTGLDAIEEQVDSLIGGSR